jgi:hypothetical protein
MASEHADVANFLTVYIKEAHPTDEWQMDSNEREGVCYPQPRTIERDFAARHAWTIPLLVDPMTNAADEAYAGWPERLYVIDADGAIAFKGDMGPFGFEPEEVEAWLVARRAMPANVGAGG